MDFDDLLDSLNINLGDSDNFTFTPEQKTLSLEKAIKDAWVVKPIWNTGSTFSVTNYQLAIPAGMTTVTGVYTRGSTTDFPQPIDSGYYSVEGSNIQFSQAARYGLNSGSPLFIKGKYKYTIADTITEVAVQEYVLTLAELLCVRTLMNMKVDRFLKNDTTMADLVARKRELENDVREARRRLTQEFQDA